MGTRTVSIVLFILSLLLIAVGHLLSNPNIIGVCVGAGSGCISQSVLFGIGFPLSQALYLLPLLFLTLAFVPQSVFTAWGKVALPLGIFFLLWIISAPPLPESVSADRTTVTEGLVKVFVVISAIVIGLKWWSVRAGKK